MGLPARAALGSFGVKRLLALAVRGSLARAWVRRSPLWVVVAGLLWIGRRIIQRTDKVKG